MDNEQNLNFSNTNNKPSSNNSNAVLVTILLVILIGAGVFYGQQFYKKWTFRSVVKNTLPQGYRPTALSEGEYPRDFPKNTVIKDGNPVWQRGEDTVVGTGERQRIVELTYTTNSAKLTTQYEANMLELDWKESARSVSADASVLSFFKGENIMDITIVPKGNGSFVNLKYVGI